MALRAQGAVGSANYFLWSYIACLHVVAIPLCTLRSKLFTRKQRQRSVLQSQLLANTLCHVLPTHSGLPMPRCRAEPHQSHSLRSIAHRLPPDERHDFGMNSLRLIGRTAIAATSSLRLRASQGARQCRLQSALQLMATPPSLRSRVSANARSSFHQHTRSALAAVPTPSLLFAPSVCR